MDPVPAPMGFPTTILELALLRGSDWPCKVALIKKLAAVSKLILSNGLVDVSIPSLLHAR